MDKFDIFCKLFKKKYCPDLTTMSMRRAITVYEMYELLEKTETEHLRQSVEMKFEVPANKLHGRC